MMNKVFVISAMVTACLVLWSPADAAEWVSYGEDATGAKLFYDKATLVRAGNIVTVWTRDQDLANPEDIRSNWEVNCAAKRSKLVSFSRHNPDGSLIETKAMSYPKWRDISPGSTGEMLLKAVCQEEKQ